MLVASASKRRGSEHFATDRRFDIMGGERMLGRFVSPGGKGVAARLDLDGREFTVGHAAGAEEEKVYEAVGRWVGAMPKPPPDRWELKDQDGQVLASAEQKGEVFHVTHGGERFRFAKGKSRLCFDLLRGEEPKPLGSVGQRKFWTTKMHMDLPDFMAPEFQVFLLAVLLGLIMQRAERMTSAPTP
jgi:hypothetical protein